MYTYYGERATTRAMRSPTLALRAPRARRPGVGGPRHPGWTGMAGWY